MKSLGRGRRFKGERYVNSENTFINNGNQFFFIKGKCKSESVSDVTNVTCSYILSCEVCIL